MKLITATKIVAVVVPICLGGMALAGGASERAPGQNKDAIAGFYAGTGSPTPSGEISNLGGAISGGFFGNTSNAGVDSDAPARGRGVTPSISPGPSTVDGGFGTLGGLIGEGHNK